MFELASNEDKISLEAKILAWAFRQSFEMADGDGALLAHKQLCRLLKGDKNGEGNLGKVNSDMSPDINAGFDMVSMAAALGAKVETNNLYNLLEVDPLSPFETIHHVFVSQLRKILVKHAREHKNPNYDFYKISQLVMKLWIAHDILSDPATRLDYDLRQARLGGNKEVETKEENKESSLKPNQILIGKLLQIARVLEPKELDIAVDMHKALPGLRFGQFLVTAGFLTQDELDAALLGQRLILAGKITVAQFEKAMHDLRHKKVAFFDTLVEQGWIKPHDIFSSDSDLWRDTGVL